MYVLVRRDLDVTYRCVQGGHAISKFALDHYDKLKEWNNNTIVYLGVPNEYVLNLWVSKLEDKEKIYSCFIEPDLGDKITSIACVDTGEIFKSLRIV